MRKILQILVFTFLSMSVFSQVKLKAYFENKIDTIKSDTRKEITLACKVIIPMQDSFTDARIEISVGENEIWPDNSKIYLPSDRSIKVDNSKDTLFKTFDIKVPRDKKDDRIVILKLTGYDKAGKSLTLVDSNIVYRLYIKPIVSDTLSEANKQGYEFWFFTGTNLDLLDGVKLKELYFKGSCLINFKNGEKSTRSWSYFTFGKNRFFSDKDSLSRIPFSDMIQTATPGDSITIARGYYSSFRETVTDNIFSSIDYLINIKELSSEDSKFFLNCGLYFGLQTLKTSYNNHDIISDTNIYLRKLDSSYIFRPLLSESKIRQANFNLSVGFMHILSTDKINIKTHFTGGINIFDYPYSIVKSSINEYDIYKREMKPYIQIRLESTVLNPGLSIGFETFIRQGQIPLFNVSLTKVLDIQQISSLFGKVPTID